VDRVLYDLRAEALRCHLLQRQLRHLRPGVQGPALPEALTLRAFDYLLKCEGVRITDDLKMAA